jgi:hypothetical protein
MVVQGEVIAVAADSAIAALFNVAPNQISHRGVNHSVELQNSQAVESAVCRCYSSTCEIFDVSDVALVVDTLVAQFYDRMVSMGGAGY